MLRAMFLIFMVGIILTIIGFVGLVVIPALFVTFGLVAAIIAAVITFIFVCALLCLIL